MMAHLSLDRQVIMEDGMLDRSVICKLVIGLSGHHGSYSAIVGRKLVIRLSGHYGRICSVP